MSDFFDHCDLEISEIVGQNADIREVQLYAKRCRDLTPRTCAFVTIHAPEKMEAWLFIALSQAFSNIRNVVRVDAIERGILTNVFDKRTD